MRTALLVLAVLTMGASNASAQQARSAKNYSHYSAISGRISIVDIDHVGSTIGLGAAYDFGMTPDWVMSLGIDYWRESDDDLGVEVSIRDIALGGFAKFMFPTSSADFRPYAGAGLAIHMLKQEIETDGIIVNRSRYEDSETELGIDLGGGFLYQSSADLGFIGELKFREVEAIDQLFLTFGLQTDI